MLKENQLPCKEWTLQGLWNAPYYGYDELVSTNHWCKTQLRSLPNGTLVVADYQSAGHGRHGRPWIAPPQANLLFSVVIDLQSFDAITWAQITQVAALELSNVCRDLLHLDLAMKWPNDLLWNDAKLCGILAEMIQPGPRMILGMGINVNTTAEDFASLDRKAISLAMITGNFVDRTILLQSFIQRLQVALETLREKGITPWLAQWRTMQNFVGHSAKVVLTDRSEQGTIAGIWDDGSLDFLCANGARIRVYSGDLEI